MVLIEEDLVLVLVGAALVVGAVAVGTGGMSPPTPRFVLLQVGRYAPGARVEVLVLAEGGDP